MEGDKAKLIRLVGLVLNHININAEELSNAEDQLAKCQNVTTANEHIPDELWYTCQEVLNHARDLEAASHRFNRDSTI